MNNNHYNLMNQIVQEQKSLWRIERDYLKESGSDEERALWEELLASKREQVARMRDLLK